MNKFFKGCKKLSLTVEDAVIARKSTGEPFISFMIYDHVIGDFFEHIGVVFEDNGKVSFEMSSSDAKRLISAYKLRKDAEMVEVCISFFEATRHIIPPYIASYYELKGEEHE